MSSSGVLSDSGVASVNVSDVCINFVRHLILQTCIWNRHFKSENGTESLHTLLCVALYLFERDFKLLLLQWVSNQGKQLPISQQCFQHPENDKEVWMTDSRRWKRLISWIKFGPEVAAGGSVSDQNEVERDRDGKRKGYTVSLVP